MGKYNFDDEEIELDDELQEKFGDEFSSAVSRQIGNSTKKKNNDKSLKFHKDGYFDKNRK
jgi:hypothetical protein